MNSLASPLLRIAAVLLSAIVLSCGGCQTSKGLGEDVENLGNNIQDAAK